MKYSVFIKKEIFDFKPALFIDKAFPASYRRFFNVFLSGVIFILFLLFGIFYLEKVITISLGEEFKLFVSKIGFYKDILIGVFLLAVVLKIKLFAINAFFNTYYFKGIPSVIEEYGKEGDGPYALFETASILNDTKDTDVTGGFLENLYGVLILGRCGIKNEEVSSFLEGEREKINTEDITSELEGYISLREYSKIIYENDNDFQRFLAKNEIQKSDFLGAASFVDHANQKFKEKKRWWSKRKLNRINGVGKGWSYGKVFILKRYGDFIENLPVYSGVNQNSFFGNEEIEKMETTLSRERGANIMFVGGEGSPRLDIMALFSLKIKKGKTSLYLKEKRIFVLNGNTLVSVRKNKVEFEKEFISLLNQAKKAGNIVLVIESFISLIKGAEYLGSDAIDILKNYLNSKDLNVIALVEPNEFHSNIESSSKLMTNFEVIYFEVEDSDSILKILEDKALALEYRFSVMFTYPAILKIAEGAERYFSSNTLVDKSVDLIMEAVSFAKKDESYLINKEIISKLVESKTGVPLGEVSEDEKKKLLDLEEKMSEKIVGQEKAVSKISESIRRARMGIRSYQKPIGTFLFMGPTGVGKTHTAKTLAEVFFGDKNKMMRLDMSEYSGEDALSKLIGSFENKNSGNLSSLIRENQYGVLLLDEFEKTNKSVHDLFLQILEDGSFSDYKGRKVNTRNLIIIATSNAGSDFIWELFKKKEEVNENKDLLLDKIIKKGIFKPELINRFDGVVVFHPLEESHLRKIAKILLQNLNKNLKKKGLELEINDSLIDFLVENGYDPQFGARPMKRVIQDKIEHTIAEKMLRGEIKSGMKVSLTKVDLE